MRRIKHIFVIFKYRFDMGYQVFGLINYGLLLIAVSDKIKTAIKIEKTGTILIVFIPLGFIIVYLLGFLMDKCGWVQAISEANQQRNKEWREVVETLREIKNRDKK